MAGRLFLIMRFKVPAGIRPTTSRNREALFNVLYSRVGSLNGFFCLDLFAGSGALGLTALQKGGSKLIAVEHSPPSCKCILSNAQDLKLRESVQIWQKDVFKISFKEPTFDLALADPPYDSTDSRIKDLFKIVSTALKKNAVFVLELGSQTQIENLQTDWQLLIKKVYGDSALWFWQKL